MNQLDIIPEKCAVPMCLNNADKGRARKGLCCACSKAILTRERRPKDHAAKQLFWALAGYAGWEVATVIMREIKRG